MKNHPLGRQNPGKSLSLGSYTGAVSSGTLIMGFILFTALMHGISIAQETANPILRILVVDQSSVRIVYSLGKDVTVRESRKIISPKIAADKLTAGWLNSDELVIPELNFEGPVSRILTLYKNGKVLRTIVADEACIKGWEFVHNGKRVALVDGGLNSGNNYKLYDVSSGKLLESIANPAPEQIPEWGKGLMK